MDEWMKLPVGQLKRLVKSRAGRIAELQMEIKILEGIIERKVQQGDLGSPGRGMMPRKPARNEGEGAAQPNGNADGAEKSEPHLSKITSASSGHAFKELD